jgi:aspartate aminotransferase
MTGGSAIRKMFEEGIARKKKYGEENVFDLSLGNPVIEPPPAVLEELKKLANSSQPGLHRYMENAGYPDTRIAVAKQLSDETGIKFSLNDIVMTCGAAGALNVVLKSILDPGDEVIVFSPFFAEYDNYVNNHGGILKVVPTDDFFIPRLDLLKSTINSRTKAIIMNSPNNPTGTVYDMIFITRLADLLNDRETAGTRPIYIINDEPYKKLIYDGLEFINIQQYYRHSITVTSHSKDLALPGERIGYAAVNPEIDSHKDLIAAMIFCNRILGFVNAPALMQHVVKNLQGVTVNLDDYQKKRDFLYDNLTQMGFKVRRPAGAFYMFPKTPVEDDVAFVADLSEENVLVVPGSSFGRAGYFRIAYCVEDRTLKGAMAGFRKVAQKYGMM